MKKNTRLFVCFIILSIFIINLFTPIEKISHEIVSLTIDLLQPDETFQVMQAESKLKIEQESTSTAIEVSKRDLEAEEIDRLLAQAYSSLPEEVGHDFV